MEKWKIIKGFDGIYRVSNTGRVQSRRNKNGKIITNIWRDLSINERNGYLFVVLYKNKERHMMSIHRIVADAFISNPFGKSQVNHKNGDKHDNRIENLEWATSSENMKHSFTILHPNLFEKRKVPIIQLSKDGGIIKHWESAADAARYLGIKRTNIVHCCKKHTGFKTAGGYKWKYNED